MRKKPVSVTMIGCGLMARHHVSQMLAAFPNTTIPVLCEPTQGHYAEMARVFDEAGLPPPPNEPDLTRLLAVYGPQLDAAFIVTPHVYHYAQAKACLEAGLDVLLEKPMVMSVAEAEALTAVVQNTGRLLVVAFQGSLSPEVQTAVSLLRAGKLGRILNISGNIWQNWHSLTTGTWRVQPELSGGGFFFDTGAHLLNTVAELAGEPFVEVAAWLNNEDQLVDISGVVIGRLRSGALVTLNACGNTAPSCASDITVWGTAGMLRTGAWGRILEVQYDQAEGWQPVEVPAASGQWGQFLHVRAGRLANPSPAEAGLRMARLWNAIQASAARHGQPVPVAIAPTAQPLEVDHV